MEADNLRLYSILIPGDDTERLKDELRQLSLEGKSCLDPRAKLSKLFPESGEEEWLIVVDGPNSGAPLSRYYVALLTISFAS